MHSVMLQLLVAERVREMIATADAVRRVRQVRCAQWSRASRHMLRPRRPRMLAEP
jgi:hypothetical protein